jgi:hypothetical protein
MPLRVLLAAILISMTGCGVVSLHPLVMPNDNDEVFEPSLVGTWAGVQEPGDTHEAKFVVAHTNVGYSIKPDTDDGEYTMRLLKVGDRYLMDVDCPSNGPALPVHIFFKLRWEKDRAWVSAMDSQWLMDQIEAKGQLRHDVLTEDFNRIVLTASPADLHRIFLPYAADDRSFEEEGELRRIQ